eukprot:487354-Rhodomonas_salina.1
MSGTDRAYHAFEQKGDFQATGSTAELMSLDKAEVATPPMILRVCYAVFCTDVSYAATRRSV